MSVASVHDSRDIEGLIEMKRRAADCTQTIVVNRWTDIYRKKEKNRKKSKTKAKVDHIFGFQAQRGVGIGCER